MNEYTQLDEILNGCLKNNREAQHALFDMFASKMFVICLRYAHSNEEAEDILIEGFTNAFVHLRDFKKNSSFKTWLQHIIVNAAIDSVRSNRRYQLNEQFDDIDSECLTAQPEENIFTHLEAKQLLKFIEQMPDSLRVIFNMRIFDEYSFCEIATALGRNENTVRKYYQRAREWLTNELKDEYSLHTNHLSK